MSQQMIMFLFLLVVDVLVVMFHFFFGQSIGFFQIEGERNLASVYSGILFMGMAVASIGSYFIIRRHGSWYERAVWFFLGLGTLYMGTDEMAIIHERVGFVMNNRLGLGGYMGESFNWVIYYTPAIIASVFVFWRLLHVLDRLDRSLTLMALVGIVFMFAALGVEVWGGTLLADPMYEQVLILEEFLEMLGESLLLVALVSALTKIFHQHFVRRS